jgi:hypothetical protein
MKPMLFPAVGRTSDWSFGTVAVFFDSSAAIDFISAEAPHRDLYLGNPTYDRRKSGYRPVEKPSGYEAWLIEVGVNPKTGAARIAA